MVNASVTANVTLVGSAFSVPAGTAVDSTATVDQVPGYAVPTGTFTITDNGNPVTVLTLPDHTFSLVCSPGLHFISASYSGDATHRCGFAKAKVTVT